MKRMDRTLNGKRSEKDEGMVHGDADADQTVQGNWDFEQPRQSRDEQADQRRRAPIRNDQDPASTIRPIRIQPFTRVMLGNRWSTRSQPRFMPS